MGLQPIPVVYPRMMRKPYMHIRTSSLSLKVNQREAQKSGCRDPEINPVQNVPIFDPDLC
jgi:hypothetical protein